MKVYHVGGQKEKTPGTVTLSCGPILKRVEKGKKNKNKNNRVFYFWTK